VIMRVLGGLSIAIAPLGSLSGQAAPRSPGPAFLFARYASQSPLALYGGYRLGRTLLVVGMLQDHRSSYREALAGVGISITYANGDGVTFLAAAADASDGWHAQLYALPTLTVSRLSVSGTVELYAPLERRASWQLYITPGTALVSVSSKVAVGASYLLSAQQGAKTGHALGPVGQIRVPHATITAALMRNVRHARDELRVYLYTAF
jgi:hypothetical protein